MTIRHLLSALSKVVWWRLRVVGRWNKTREAPPVARADLVPVRHLTC